MLTELFAYDSTVAVSIAYSVGHSEVRITLGSQLYPNV